jgi:hypothetical protein
MARISKIIALIALITLAFGVVGINNALEEPYTKPVRIVV